MKRKAVLDKIKAAADVKGLAFTVIEGTRHSFVRVGKTTRTLGRHAEIDDKTAVRYFKQFVIELGEKWWRN
jgi:hypothetical protein